MSQSVIGVSQVDALEIFKNDREIGNKIKIVKVNLEEEPLFIEKYRIETDPTQLLFYNGEIIYRNIGYIDSPHLRQYLRPYVKFDERK
ncbi:thioredoxin family protein [bacterium]|nr:thioredoxin family protein [bacterium]